MGQELVALRAKLEQQAEAAAARLPAPAGDWLSTKAGVLSFHDQAMPGNQVCVVIVDSIFENGWYKDKFIPGVKAVPTCYAIAREVLDLAPHPSMQAFPEVFEPQHDECQGCPKNEWGTADIGRGKACKNGVRLAMVPAGFYEPPKRGSRDCGDAQIYTDAKEYLDADLIFMKLPPTSIKIWAKYVNDLMAGHRLPPHGVITRVYLEPHENDQFNVKFEMIETVSDDLLPVVMQRNEEAEARPIQGYTPPEEREDATASTGGIRGLRRR